METLVNQNTELSSKTFDQQVNMLDSDLSQADISPNLRVPCEMVFEPVLNGVRVTARDEQHKVLWGFIGSEKMLEQIHCPVAVYGRLQELLQERLEKRGLAPAKHHDPIAEANASLEELEKTLVGLRNSLSVKGVSEATVKRAAEIARVAEDAKKMLCVETSSVVGSTGKSRGKQ